MSDQLDVGYTEEPRYTVDSMRWKRLPNTDDHPSAPITEVRVLGAAIRLTRRDVGNLIEWLKEIAGDS